VKIGTEDIQKIKKKILALMEKRPERIGIHIEGEMARIVKLVKKDEDTLKLGAFEDVPFSLIDQSLEQQKNFLKAVNQVGSGLQKVAVNIEDPSLRIRRMVFAKMPEADLLEAIRWNFREHIEVPIEEYVVGYTALRGTIDDNKRAIIGYGVAKKAIDDYQERFKVLGLKPVSLEPISSSLLASFYTNGILNDDGYHVCIYFGETMASFVVMKHDELLFSRPLAGLCQDMLKKNMIRDIGVTKESLDEMFGSWLKKARDVEVDEPTPVEPDMSIQSKFDGSMRHCFSNLVIEVQRSIDAFCIQYDVERIDCIHVCGIGTYYPGMVKHIEKTLGIRTEAFNSFANLMDESLLKGDYIEKAPLFAVAVGLALS
jgi:Tfp pilus assembly PilM family ATPase